MFSEIIFKCLELLRFRQCIVFYYFIDIILVPTRSLVVAFACYQQALIENIDRYVNLFSLHWSALGVEANISIAIMCLYMPWDTHFIDTWHRYYVRNSERQAQRDKICCTNLRTVFVMNVIRNRIKIFSNLKFEFMPANFEMNAKTKNLQKWGVL